MKDTPHLRQCISCREMKKKDDLIRIVRNADGVFQIDRRQKQNGRGAYLCRDRSCIELAEKRNLLARSFKQAVPQEIYEELKSYNEN